MNERRRHDAATATVGLAGVAAGGALRHSGLEAAYEGGPRPRFFQERRFLRAAKVPGRRRYGAAMALGLVSVPPAAVGSSRLLRKEPASKRDDRRSFIGEGITGVKESFTERNKTIAERPPARLVAGNYIAGGAIGSAAGGLTHMALGRTKIPGTARAGAAAAAGILAGSGTLPVQSKLTQRASHGKYEVTPTGVRRRRTPAKRPSSSANVVEGRPGKTTMSGHALRQQMVGKADDPGASMSRGERRARVTAAGVPVPLVGDAMQAATAARLSPEKYRRRTAVQNFAGGQAGQVAGTVAATAGALALARRSPGFARRAAAANASVERVKGAAQAKARIKPSTKGPLHERVLTHPRTPGVVTRTGARALQSRAGRAVAANPEVAAISGLVGGSVGGQIGQQATYSGIMRRDDRYRRQHNQSARRGSKAVAKAEESGMSRREELDQIRRKRRSAAVAAMTSAGSIGATGLLGASFSPKVRSATRGKLRTASFATGTIAGGIAAANGLESAHLQRRDLRAREHALMSKAATPLPWPGMSRARFARTFGQGKGGTRLIPAHHLQSVAFAQPETNRARALQVGRDALSRGQRRPVEVEVFPGHPDRTVLQDGYHRTSGIFEATRGKGKVKVYVDTPKAARAESNRRFAEYRRTGKLPSRDWARGVPTEEEFFGKAVLRPTGIRRAPGMRRGFFRQTRTSTGVKTAYVRGGLA